MKLDPNDPLAARATSAVVKPKRSVRARDVEIVIHEGNTEPLPPPLSLVLPYPPSVNSIYGQKGMKTKGGKVFVTKFKTAEHKAYFGKVSNAWRVAQLSNPIVDAYPTRALIKLTVKLYRPMRRGDLDNRLKTLLDALTFSEKEGQPGAWFDDEQIEELHAFRYDDKENPRAELLVEPVRFGPTVLKAGEISERILTLGR